MFSLNLICMGGQDKMQLAFFILFVFTSVSCIYTFTHFDQSNPEWMIVTRRKPFIY